MRPTPALSVLLVQLVLLLSPPSLSQNDGNETSTSVIKPGIVNSQGTLLVATSTTPTQLKANDSKLMTATFTPAQSSNPTSSKTSVQPSMTITTTRGVPTAPSTDSKEVKTKASSPSSTAPTNSSGQTISSGHKSGDGLITAPPTTLKTTNYVSSQTADVNASSKLPSTPTTVSTASPHQPVASSQSAETLSQRQHTPTAVPSTSDSVSSTVNSTLSWKPTTTHPSLGTSEATQPTTSQVPTVTALPVSTPLQPTASLVGTELKCDPPIMPDEELLILNFTRVGLCDGNPPDERLVELLCYSVKASFKPAEDSCVLQLAPILEDQAVAVKRITIETKLSPKNVYELLKDRWDDLAEAGVSDMKLGKEGPPEANEDRFSLPLIITIVCMASFLLLVAALYGCCHQRISQRKDQQRLTEELQTVENGYHDNPTLEVMETPSEMQEKKVVNLNGELGDSWIVPLDNLTKDDLDEEEDTHL
ncbi:Podocalyxin [Apodemus speciosus]|uniref:Podocalyxin n=1 Tax=Apodemus speciosus TaxID=105296 RepID=A0ABQ0EV21_APOSI